MVVHQHTLPMTCAGPDADVQVHDQPTVVFWMYQESVRHSVIEPSLLLVLACGTTCHSHFVTLHCLKVCLANV